MRILIIGNSHVGALSQAFQSAEPQLDLEVEFLASNGRALAKSIAFEGWQLKLNASGLGPSLVAPTSLIESGTLDVKGYNLVFLYGCQLLSRGGGWDWIRLVANSGKDFSNAAWDALARDHVRGSDHFSMVNNIKNKDLVARLASLPCPLPNITHPKFQSISKVRTERIQHVFDVAEQEMQGLGIRLHQLPSELLDSRGYATAYTFKSESVADFSHLNKSGGELVRNLIIKIALCRD